MHHIFRFLHHDAIIFFALIAAVHVNVNVNVNALSTKVPAVPVPVSVSVPFASPSLSSTTLSTPTRTTSILNVNINADDRHQHQHKIGELLHLLYNSVRVLDLDEVNMNMNSPKLVLDACFALCSAMEHTSTSMIQNNNSNGGVSMGIHTHIDMSEKEKQQQDQLEEPVILSHFFEEPLWNSEFESLTSSVMKLTTKTFADRNHADVDLDDEKLLERLMDAADVVAASAKFMLLPSNGKHDILDTLDAALAHETFLTARTMALTACSRDSKIRHNANPEDIITEKDNEVVKALYECVIRQLGPLILTPLGFPCNKLGLRGFVVAARKATNTQRAASALGRIWHAAKESGPMIVIPNPAAAACLEATGSLENYTLVIAFSALGWNGIVRPEWGGTLRDSKHTVIVHAFDSCKSWFMTNPKSGAFDDGAWWDESLADLAAPFGRVCLVGESMGGTAALRFARHASKSGTVVSLVPQINLNDFPAFSVRDDFDKVQMDRLRGQIQQSLESTNARAVIHVGRNPDDLRQLLHIEDVVQEHSFLGLQADAPLPRYSSQSSHTVGNFRLRVVKHDIEGHAMGAGLKAKGVLRKVVLEDLLGNDPWQYCSG